MEELTWVSSFNLRLIVSGELRKSVVASLRCMEGKLLVIVNPDVS